MTKTLLTNVAVRALDTDLPAAEGLLIEDGVIAEVYREAQPVAASDDVVDCQGGYLLPGLVDAHCHLFAVGEWDRLVDVRGAGSAAEAAQVMASHAATQPEGQWIRGQGWDDSLWGHPPHHRTLDEVSPQHPVLLTRVDGHAVWANAVAMARLRETHGDVQEIPGGEIVRDGEGAPSGVFVDRAMELFDDLVPRDDAAQLRSDFLRAQDLYLSCGLIGGHDMSTTPEQLAVLEELERGGALELRVSCYLFGSLETLAPILDRGRRAPELGGKVHVAGVKLFVDGALGSHGAAMLEPYLDRSTSRGLLVTEWEDLYSQAKAVHDAGWQLAIHAIGDRANRLALDCIEKIGGAGRGHRVEHAQIVHPTDVERFSRLGAVASMQPVHWASDHRWLEERVSPTARDGAYAWRSLESAGALLALGSDAPIESPDPWAGIQAASSRPGTQSLSAHSALRGYSAGAAQAVGASYGVGIAPGLPADFTLVDRDPCAVPASELGHITTLCAVTGGRVHWVRDT